MTFASLITRCSIPYEPDRGQEAAALFPDSGADIQNLVAGAAGNSPYLAGLIQKEKDWLCAAFARTPDAVFNEILGSLEDLPLEQLATALRQGKHRVAVFTALADLGGIWTLEEVTGALTRFADMSVDVAMKSLVAAEIRRGKLPGMSEEDIETAGGMVALAMGKMGAGELNYSSDIDLICLFDENRFDTDSYHDARASFIRVTRRMTAMLSDLTGDGYVFRTDLRLRPDPSVTPVCLSMDAAERYYESVGRTWERAAHIKARPCAGDIQAGWRYLERLRPFVWRKHLDFAAIQDAHDMRLRIRDHKGLGGAIDLFGHNMKLGRGGIREIEFFTQTRQIIAGGRDAELRSRETVPGLKQLAEKGWVPPDVTDVLIANYRSHREVEHRLQMVNDAQTHDLPNSDEGFDRLARFMGESDTGAFKDALMQRLTKVHELTEGFFAPVESSAEPELSEATKDVVERWRSYPALRSDRAVTIFGRLKPEILSRLQKAAKPDEALYQFDGFLAGLPAGVQLFSLFEANPQLIDLLIDICATAPALAHHLSQNSKVLDAVIGGSFFDEWLGPEQLSQDLIGMLADLSDYEAKLDTARRWAKEWHFRIGVHHLRGLISGREAGQQYAELAEAVLAALWPVVVDEFSGKHGDPPGYGAIVLGMGSLGAGQLNSGSDLDLIVIYDANGVDTSDGRRPLLTRLYYARLTQALVTALSAPMSEGRLYEVDMRLRPSGRQGPVATSYQSFTTYQQEEAWTWEHLALTRARVVAGDKGLAKRIESFRASLLSEKGAPDIVVRDVLDMRARLAEAKPAIETWEAKLGRGRLQDIELLAQAGALMAGDTAPDIQGQLKAACKLGWVSEADMMTLRESYELMWRVQIGAKLLSDRPLDMDDIGEGGRVFMLRETKQTEISQLRADMEERGTIAASIIDHALANVPHGKARR
ncbi:bifunctional [glutamine synthetase] adenylyltransferase/[glutamine synthetase]-adenylyl-L-tyrosine phosphorylase [Pseudohalocynthiibacter aestuariivivens]|uniref:Bifunctional [glutamine synthetase] adenylyltransferase/[glutamine synthetase]-adenylyl-L-tyrosine phosphorylase n=1 Tax=Pseudohalocynthiibacter aestuariivivens TaxID=1591409 RepID=A0ABV5JHG7_9RHOB|nr:MULTISPECIES: bifunctional [glutamine synthetase] adenylyltransferase/[glutamine synthetase]-adenylyl-L-tyrosine phosphorylase [Pseudohalocynthiibacter]MBS9716378.1 bifunctional [glutamine synthetase] adenylyltransferase/[glutamine synthetase]-adenylyl-L-tyrosine phosphorylase [Pseudohalocynthiibacter aestuariivivens]MCK0100813.1 bifunctional [glutamine synthetase] adenylyltransferase/[glutamine synthetase]-adenylyl-L-tyrosine phosphorylase [Pseudohalocynthiibacter sp. F2068]